MNPNDFEILRSLARFVTLDQGQLPVHLIDGVPHQPREVRLIRTLSSSTSEDEVKAVMDSAVVEFVNHSAYQADCMRPVDEVLGRSYVTMRPWTACVSGGIIHYQTLVSFFCAPRAVTIEPPRLVPPLTPADYDLSVDELKFALECVRYCKHHLLETTRYTVWADADRAAEHQTRLRKYDAVSANLEKLLAFKGASTPTKPASVVASTVISTTPEYEATVGALVVAELNQAKEAK